MAGNSAAVQVRVEAETARAIGHQRAHDLRIGPQPEYVDPQRTHLNRVLIENATGGQLRKICEERRKKRATKRAMKSDAAVGWSGIITFGHAAQTYFEALTPEQQDEAFWLVAERVAERLETSLHGLVVHLDEAAIHAHFQLAGVTMDGMPVSQIAKRQALRDIQTAAAEVMAEYAPKIERGKSRWQRIEEGESYADTVYKDGATMRRLLTEDIPAAEKKLAAANAELEEVARDKRRLSRRIKENDETILRQFATLEDLVDRIAKAQERREKNIRLALKARAKARDAGDKAASALKRAETYERRAADALADLEALGRQTETLETSIKKL